ncbi:uncharacterized protein [Ptychodera flava]|uniref:uncharacterized protein n=1 Tax=Ptychodera flava TaxID=63121 RepID=UPI00396A3C1A
MVKLVIPCTMVIAALTASLCFCHELQPPPEPQEYKEAVLGHSLTLECLVETPSNATGRWYRFDGQKKTQIVDHSGSVISGYEPTGDKTRGEHNLLIVKVARRDQTVFGCSHIHRTPQWYYINVTVVDAADSSAGIPSSDIINALMASLFMFGLKSNEPSVP